MSVSLHSGTADFLHVTLVPQGVPGEAGEEGELGGGGGPGYTQVILLKLPREVTISLSGSRGSLMRTPSTTSTTLSTSSSRSVSSHSCWPPAAAGSPQNGKLEDSLPGVTEAEITR